MYSSTVLTVFVSLFANIAIASEFVNDPPLLVVPADGSAVRFSVERSAPNALQGLSRHEIGFFYVDAPDGRILRRIGSRHDSPPSLDSRKRPQFARPGDSDYADIALRDGRAIRF